MNAGTALQALAYGLYIFGLFPVAAWSVHAAERYHDIWLFPAAMVIHLAACFALARLGEALE